MMKSKMMTIWRICFERFFIVRSCISTCLWRAIGLNVVRIVVSQVWKYNTIESRQFERWVEFPLTEVERVRFNEVFVC